MNNNHSRKLQTFVKGLLVASIGAGLLSACSTIRQVTYPPGFVYLERAEVQTTMSELGQRIWEMDTLLAQKDQMLENRPRVIELLGDIESYAETLETSGHPTNHLLIDERMSDFVASVALAKLSLEMEPPNFYGAGQISGQCMGCHIHRK